jgi:O-antigen biosynthesis protein
MAHLAKRALVVFLRSGPLGLARSVGQWTSARRIVEAADFDAEYRLWLKRREPNARELWAMRARSRLRSGGPLISAIMPVHAPDLSLLNAAVESLRSQAYERWELCVADDPSTPPHVRASLLRLQSIEGRIKLTSCEQMGSRAAASNSALALASGEYVALMDQDAILPPHALHRVVEYLRAHPDADIVYSDEDEIYPDSGRGGVSFKPDWSPVWLLSHNYVGHLTVIRSSLIEEVDGFRPDYDGGEDHDLLLRASERAHHVGHIPDVLYSIRKATFAVAPAGQHAVADALGRRGMNARVELSAMPGVFNVIHEVVDTPRIAVVIPTRDRLDLLRRCISELERISTYTNYEIVIVDNNSSEAETLEYLEATPHQVVRAPGEFNYSRLVNLGVRSSDARFALLLNNDSFIKTPDALKQLVGLAQLPEVGAVGCRLRYPDGRLQHCGVGLGDGCLGFNLHFDFPGVRDVTAVTGACMLTKRDVFEEVDGFDETLAVVFNDVDFCLRVNRRGHRIVYSPLVEFEHHESASRGGLHPESDNRVFRTRWGTEEQLRDHYLSPNLTWQRKDRPHLAR